MSHRLRTKPRSSQAQKLEALRSSVDQRINKICCDKNEWVNICRNTLLEMEKRNIHRRATHWTSLVNDKVKDTNSRLSLDSTMFESVTHSFTYAVDNAAMAKHLGFIISWKGLKTRQIQNAPKTYLDFENKAKNWLNGRRAPNYAATLFPAMIRASEIYADYVSRQIFANNPKFSKIYCRICTIGFLSSLCSARISLNDASKKAYLICENSVKTGKTAVSQILQRYASDHPYQDKFPSHLREASDYFENKYMELISDFAIELNQKQREQKLNRAKNIGGHVLDIINQTDDAQPSESTGSVHSVHSPSMASEQKENDLPSSVTHSIMKDIHNCDGNLNTISMSIDQFNKLAQFISGMITNQKTQQGTIDDLVSRVQQLETQQQNILRDVTSNSPRSMGSGDNNPVRLQPNYSNPRNGNHANHMTQTNCHVQQSNVRVRTAPQQPFVQPQPVRQSIPKYNNARSPPSIVTTESTQSIPTQQPVRPPVIHHAQHHVHMNRRNMMNRMQYNHMVGVPQMNQVSSITSLPVPQITNINVNQMQNINHMTTNNTIQPHIIAMPATNMISQHSNGNNTLPTTSLYGVGSYDSNDGDANMFGFGNGQSFNSSDAGMTNIMHSIPNANVTPLDSGLGLQRFSDQSMNFQTIPNMTNIVHYNQ
eukprot:193557_1